MRRSPSIKRRDILYWIVERDQRIELWMRYRFKGAKSHKKVEFTFADYPSLWYDQWDFLMTITGAWRRIECGHVDAMYWAQDVDAWHRAAREFLPQIGPTHEPPLVSAIPFEGWDKGFRVFKHITNDPKEGR